MNALAAINPTCNTFLLEAYLLGNLSVKERDWVERHLDNCDFCRGAMEQHAAGPEFWKAATRYLDPSQTNDTAASLSFSRIGRPLFASWTSVAHANTLDTEQEDWDCATSLKYWLDLPQSSESMGSLAKYQVLGVISRGGMGLVLKAHDPDLNRYVAIKTPLQHFATSKTAKLRFQREAQAAASIHHRNVIAIYSVDSWRDVPYIVMPYLDNGTLQQFAKSHRFELPEILSVASQIAEGLAAAHACGLVHRDIKPSNILLQRGLEEVVISDFGLARVMDDAFTQSTLLAGTPQFMSPEQAQGLSVDARSDLFSVGSLLYWMCTGTTPFASETSFGVLTKIAQQPHIAAMQLAAGLPAWLSCLLDRLLEKQPQHRIASATELSRLVQACQAHLNDPEIVAPPAELDAPLVKDALSSPPAGRPGLLPVLGEPVQSTLRGRLTLRSKGPVLIGAILFLLTIVSVATLCGLLILNRSGRPDFNLAASFLGNTQAGKAWTTTEANGLTSTNKSDVEISETQTSPPRYGPLDEFDMVNLRTDLKGKLNQQYWLRRLAYLPVGDVPAEVVPWVTDMSQSDDLSLRELAMVILNKNPFEVIDKGKDP